ncbi:MAG: hypothetical protein AB1670_06835 [Pseudomonadota bacterium]
MIIANMATFPKRADVLESTIKTLVNQVDHINLCLNEHDAIPTWCARYPNLHPVIPEQDWKDVGKFIFDVSPNDEVFLVDDDIIYPPDYVAALLETRSMIGLESAIVGTHAVIYSDYFDGLPASRNVRSYRQAENCFRQVNQLGTGTVCLKGAHMPPLEYMIGSERYVDVRFARYQHERGVVLISAPRSAGWMRDQKVDGGIFQEFTVVWPDEVVKETLEIAGYSKLDLTVMAHLKTLCTDLKAS